MPAGQTLQIGGLGSSGGGGGGTGTVTDVSVVTANGISGSVANSTTTPAITLTHGAITPTSVNGLTISTTTGILTLANGSTLITSGANSITLTTTGATNVTFPLSGTLATLTGSETFTNKTFASGSGTSIDGSLILAGTVNYARLGSGGGGATKFLREDNTWQAIGGGGDALVANPLSQFAATTSAQLAGIMTDETGSGALVFGTSPTLVTPILGTPTSVTLTNATGLPLTTGVTGILPHGNLGTGGGGATKFLREDSTWQTVSAGSGTVTSVSVVTANGVSGSVATATTTPAITLTLGAITPTTVNGATITTTTGGTLTLANSSSLITSGANSITLTSTGATNVTLPTSGTLITNVMTTGGDLIYGGASGVQTRLANGTAGQVLQSNGTTLAPSWVTPSGGGDMVLASVQSVTGAKTFDSNKFILAGSTSGTTILNANATAGAGTVTLPITGTLATLAQTETFTNKTLTTPKIAQINGTSNNLAVATFSDTSGAVNYLSFSSKQTGLSPSVVATGSDTDIGLTLAAKGTGTLYLQATSGLLSAVANTTQFSSSDWNASFSLSYTGSSASMVTTWGTSTTSSVVVKMSHLLTCSGTVANGFGLSTDYRLQHTEGTTGTPVSFQQIWNNASSASYIGDAKFILYNIAGNSTITLNGSGGISMVKTGGSAVTIIPHASTGAWTLTLPSGAGSNGQVLTTDGSGGTSWTTAGGMTNPMTTGGDVIYGGASGTPTRLANGSSGQVLTSAGGTSAPTWTTPAGLTGFTASLNTSSPNNTVNASMILASGGSTNQDAVVRPKGSGAFQLHLADSTSTGGNKRGTYSSDLQLIRSAATEVVGGSASFAAGGSNTVAGGYSAAFGYKNTASGDYALVSGDWSTASGSRSIAVGSTVTSSGTGSVGFGNAITASGNYSMAVGTNSQATAESSYAFGTFAKADINGMLAHSSDVYQGAGYAQGFLATLSKTTSDATVTELTTNGATAGGSNVLAVGNNRSIAFDIIVAGRRTSGANEYASYQFQGMIANAAGTTSVIGAITKTVICESNAAWDADVVANDTGDYIQINVTGAAATNISWVAQVRGVSN